MNGDMPHDGGHGGGGHAVGEELQKTGRYVTLTNTSSWTHNIGLKDKRCEIKKKGKLHELSTLRVLNAAEFGQIKRLLCLCAFRFCGGLLLDIKRKAPFFISDFTDAFHIQALSAILFIYLGTVTNAITFGGLLGDATENMQVRLEPASLPCFPFRLRSASQVSRLSCAGRAGEFSGHGDRWWGLLSAGWPTSHHPQQHRSCSGLRTVAVQLQQVRSSCCQCYCFLCSQQNLHVHGTRTFG